MCYLHIHYIQTKIKMYSIILSACPHIDIERTLVNKCSSSRYTEWVKHSGVPNYQPMWDQVFKGPSIELYDHLNDPDENANIAQNQGEEDVVKGLSQQLHEGWRKATPPKQ